MTDIHIASMTLIDTVSRISSYFNLPFSEDLLMSGVSSPDNNLHFTQLAVACQNVGIIVEHQPNTIAISELNGFPSVVEVDGECYLIVLSVDSEGVQCLTDNGVCTMPVSVIEEAMTGVSAVVSTQPAVEARAKISQSILLGDHWFWGPVLKTKRIYIDVVFASLLINAFALATPLFTMNVYDRVVPNLAFDSLWVLAAGVCIVFVFDFVMKIMRSWFIDLAGKKTDILMSAVIYARTLGMKLSNRPESVGVYSKHLQEFESVRGFLASTTITSLIDLPFAILMLGVITLIAGPLVIVPIIAMMLVVVASLLIQKPLNETIEQSNQLAAQKNANLYESLQGIESVKAHNAEGQFQFKWEQAVTHMATWGNKTRWLTNLVMTLTGFMQQLVSVGLVVYGVYLLAENVISMGAIIATVMLSGRCLQPMMQIAGLATRYSQVMTSYAQLDEIMNTPQEQQPKRRYIAKDNLRGELELRNVSFRYKSDDKQILKNISFKVQAGEKVAIIGRIGAGKTTLEKLLLNFYEPDSGAILLDGLNIQQYNPAFVRRQIGAVPQDIQLFYGSIRDNISLGQPDADMASIQDAAMRAGVTQFTRHDSEGLERQVGESGRYLSGGQRQSVALARAFLNPVSLYIMDEPTSQMDTRTEHHVKNQLSQLSPDQTLILVTHKTSMLDIVDRVIVLDGGRVVLDGERDSVIKALSDGNFAAVRRVHAA